MNKKLVLHSDQIQGKKEVDEKFLQLCGKQPWEIRISYIPSQSDVTRKYFNEKVAWYAQLWIKSEHITYFDIDKEYDSIKEDALLSNDVIFLSWGNTFYFLSCLKKRGFIEKLRAFVEQWWILIWASAGAILMSKTIWTASGIFNDDENISWLTDLSALGLNDFEFHPHFVWAKEEIEKLIEYSRWKLVYAVQDGDWIIVNGENIELIWDVAVFQNGERE